MTTQTLLQVVRVTCRMKSLLISVAADERIPSFYRDQAAECVRASDQISMGDESPSASDARASRSPLAEAS